MLFHPPHVARVIIPWIDLESLLNTAFDQIRHYATADLAVNLRLLRAMSDVAATTERSEIHAALLGRARLLVELAGKHISGSDIARLKQRLVVLENQLARQGASPNRR